MGSKPSKQRQAPNNATFHRFFAFQGRLVTSKGVRLLFEAARILRRQKKTFELLIIGDGPERASLEQFAREAQLDAQVRFAGRLDGVLLDAALVPVFRRRGAVAGRRSFRFGCRGKYAAGPAVSSPSDLGAFVEVLAMRVSHSVPATLPHSPPRSPVFWTIPRWPRVWATVPRTCSRFLQPRADARIPRQRLPENSQAFP